MWDCGVRVFPLASMEWQWDGGGKGRWRHGARVFLTWMTIVKGMFGWVRFFGYLVWKWCKWGILVEVGRTRNGCKMGAKRWIWRK